MRRQINFRFCNNVVLSFVATLLQLPAAVLFLIRPLIGTEPPCQHINRNRLHHAATQLRLVVYLSSSCIYLVDDRDLWSSAMMLLLTTRAENNDEQNRAGGRVKIYPRI